MASAFVPREPGGIRTFSGASKPVVGGVFWLVIGVSVPPGPGGVWRRPAASGPAVEERYSLGIDVSVPREDDGVLLFSAV